MANPFKRPTPLRRLARVVRAGLLSFWHGARRLGVSLPHAIFLRSPVEQRVAGHLGKPARRAVLAIADFATFPLSFDVLNLIALAELYRRRSGAAVVDFACVCDWSEPVFGYGRADVDGRPVDQATLIQNLCLEGARLLPHAGSVHFFADRPEFERFVTSRPRQTRILPDDYSVRGPSYIPHRGAPPLYGLRSLLDGEYSDREESLLRPDDASVNMVRRWLAGLPATQGPTISITVRDNAHSPGRNSDIAAWRKLVESYADTGIRFVVVPDYFKLFAPTGLESAGVTVFEEAALSLGLRSALYRASDLNLFVGNGPATIAYIDHTIPFRTFKMVTDEPSSHLDEIDFQHNLAPGRPLPWFGDDRAIVWEDDTFDVMRRELDRWLETRGSH